MVPKKCMMNIMHRSVCAISVSAYTHLVHISILFVHSDKATQVPNSPVNASLGSLTEQNSVGKSRSDILSMF